MELTENGSALPRDTLGRKLYRTCSNVVDRGGIVHGAAEVALPSRRATSAHVFFEVVWHIRSKWPMLREHCGAAAKEGQQVSLPPRSVTSEVELGALTC